MSINDYVDGVEAVAQRALGEANAIRVCSRHGVTIRVGEENAERHAYAIATNLIKHTDEYWTREDVLNAIKDQLEIAADGECPSCAYDGDH